MTDTRKSVWLCLPMNGLIEFEMARAAFVEASEDKYKVMIGRQPCSIAPFGFSQGWCNFENVGADYFAMLHSDMGASKFWLDVGIEEMEKHGYGVIHAPAAIKDDRSITSTAFGNCYFQFDKVRRLAVAELPMLPETFGIDEARKVFDLPASFDLLANTGCMIVKRDGFPFDAFAKVAFNNDIELRQTPEGKRYAVCNPEDWRFSRFCARHGIRVGCTQKIKTSHFGGMVFRCDQPWGTWKRDEAYFEG